MIIPPLANQPIAHQFPPTREHHQFLLALHSELLAAQDRIAALEAISGDMATLGPFYINDVPAGATTVASLGFFNTATAVSQSARPPRMPRNGRVVAIRAVSDDNITSGQATFRVNINTVSVTFDGGSANLNAVTNINRVGVSVAYASGVPFNAGNDVGVDVNTSAGFLPTTANFTVWIDVRFDPF